MISPELLKRYPFFSSLLESQLTEIAMIADEIDCINGETLFEENQPANTLYLLINGGIDLTIKSEEEFHPTQHREFTVGEINPGEIFGISALAEPSVYDATARTSRDSQIIKIDAEALRGLMKEDVELANHLMVQVIRELKERLRSTRVQLAAAWA